MRRPSLQHPVRWIAIFFILTGLVHQAGAEPATPVPPAAQFFENDAFGGAVFSPNGKFLAVRTHRPGARDYLAVIDLETKAGTVVAAFADADIGDFQWVDDERLVYNVHDKNEASGDAEVAPGAPQPWNTFLLDQTGSQDSEWIYVQRPLYDDNNEYFGTDLRRLNTLTGMAEFVPQPGVKVGSFMLDAHGEPRLAQRFDGVAKSILYRDPASGDWRVLASNEPYKKGTRDNIKPIGFGPDGTLYIAANAGADMATLRTFDFAAGQPSKDPLVVTRGYDFDGELIVAGAKVLGVRLTTDAIIDIWFDPAMKTIQAAVDKALPATNNLITVPARPGAPWLLVTAYSDVQPPRFLLYDTRDGTFDPIGAAYPQIDPQRMGRQQAIRYQARDGLEITGLLTLPPGAVHDRLPMVVLVHGGPWVRGASWGWNPDSQFLATRGYAVLEVDYRGTTGLGASHFEASFKQWGLAMQDDVADGARWAIAQGIADPRRICIAGASYGGYAALMGLVNDPDLFRCAVDWAGVTDIELMYNGTWYASSDMTDSDLRYTMPVMVGDLKADAAQMKATSPLQQAARIHQPVLLAYGSEDRRVPAYHGKRFRDALRRTNDRVEWVEYDGEGHGWSLPKNRIDFWQRVERFLSKAIGPGSVPAPAAPN